MIRRTRKEKVHRILGCTLMALLVVLLGCSFVIARRHVSYAIHPSRTVIRIVDTGKGRFLREREVAAVLPIDLKDSISRGVDPDRIERDLVDASTYIRSATAFISPSTKRLHVVVHERTPIIRYFRNGTSWYLDDEGISVPQRQGSTAYVPLAEGTMTDGTIHYVLYPLAQYLYDHSEWSHFFSYIEIISESKIHLYPRVGTVVFELHGLETLEQDLAKIPIYYKDIEPQVGTNKYALVKLSYENQIVCVKREK